MPSSSTVKYKLGDRVKVIKCVYAWSSPTVEGCNITWAINANNAIGKVFEIVEVRTSYWGSVDYRLKTFDCCKHNWLFPEESLELEVVIGEQLLFSFMKD